ncbi:MAG: potassium channel protein [Phycisphaeraceae bacterium]|nr:potassium channel protein [Phycisphaeraceae bacterium]
MAVDDLGFLHRKRQLIVSVFVLIIVMVVGAGGFWLIDPNRGIFDSLYLTALIITTVGMKDGSLTLDVADRVWAILLMLTGISAALYAAGNLVAFIIDGELRRFFGRRQLQNKIDRLRDHYIVCGFGRMGRALCEALHERKVPFVVVESDPERTAWADQLGYLYLLGDAKDEATLRSARLDHARGLASCLNGDADNVFVTLTARSLSEDLTITARSESLDAQPKLKRAGADRVICTPVLGARRVMQMMLHPAVDELVELAVNGPDLEISKVRIEEIPGAVGKTLRDLNMPARSGLIVVAAIRPDGSREFNPAPDWEFGEGDEMIVIGPSGGMDRLQRLHDENVDVDDPHTDQRAQA